MTISIIVAVARGGVIGSGNRLLCHIPEDLKRFKAITSGHPVVMGRKTYESIGRPLPNRTNVIITRNRGYRADGCTVVGSLDEALALFTAPEEVFIIGGGEIYAQALPLADKLYITHIDARFEGDTLFPPIDPTQWRETFSEAHPKSDTTPGYRFANYVAANSFSEATS